MNIYVGNIPFSTTEERLKEVFGEFGEVKEVRIVKDRDTGRPKGFAFVEMADDAQGQAAIDGTNEKVLDGRPMKVNEARPREERPPRRDFRRGGDFHRGGGFHRGGDFRKPFPKKEEE